MIWVGDEWETRVKGGFRQKNGEPGTQTRKSSFCSAHKGVSFKNFELRVALLDGSFRKTDVAHISIGKTGRHRAIWGPFKQHLWKILSCEHKGKWMTAAKMEKRWHLWAMGLTGCGGGGRESWGQENMWGERSEGKLEQSGWIRIYTVKCNANMRLPVWLCSSWTTFGTGAEDRRQSSRKIQKPPEGSNNCHHNSGGWTSQWRVYRKAMISYNWELKMIKDFKVNSIVNIAQSYGDGKLEAQKIGCFWWALGEQWE